VEGFLTRVLVIRLMSKR